ncbi:hypothetical protein [Noviherbaspirillum denitrificans]|uniref:Uncharacterized protein n=1 Tax=Noviherbaspirillum denitrificans TaxID=1968433 RepID=A0A254TE27_9BURK|nr:hypothetical protein [Noviherbaspirillum denitrificans]OWW20785.1 hypothetical protein AYR66_16215 [Noviherbaspirillum denitrificans]
MNRADRKKQLIAQGAVYRAEILLAKESAEASLRPDTLARSVLHQAAGALIGAFRGGNLGGLPGMNLQTLLPLVMGGISALSRRKSLLGKVLRGVAVAGVAAGAAALVLRKRKAQPEPVDDAPQVNDL